MTAPLARLSNHEDNSKVEQLPKAIVSLYIEIGTTIEILPVMYAIGHFPQKDCESPFWVTPICIATWDTPDCLQNRVANGTHYTNLDYFKFSNDY